MSAFGNLIRLIVALLSLGAAFVVLRNAGLPARSAHNGFRLHDGTYVAAEIGAIAPPLTLLRPDYRSYTLQPAKSTVTIVNFWATWCQPCHEELRRLQELADDNPQSIRVVAINLGEGRALVSEWIRELGLTVDVLIDPTQSSAESFRVRGLPATYVLDAELRIHQILYGAVSRNQLLQSVNQIAQNP